MGDLIGRKRIFLAGLALFTLASLLCGAAQTEAMLIGARFVQGIGARADLGGHPRDDRDDVPRAARAGEGDRGLQLRRLGRRLDRPARRRPHHPGHQLALDLLRQRSRSASWPRCWRCGCSSPTAGSACAPAPTSPGAALVTAALMLGVYTIVGTVDHGWGSAHTLGLGAVGGRAARGLRRPPGDGEQAARAAADLPLAQRLGRQRRAGADGRRHVRDVLPRHAVPPARAGLRRRADRRGLPARVAGHRRALARLLGAADHPLRRARRAAARARAARRPGSCCSPARRSAATT